MKEPKKRDVFELAGNIFFCVILGIMILTAVLFFLLFLLGIQVYRAGGEMSPDIEENSLVLVVKTDPVSIDEGSRITYVIDESGNLKTGEVIEKNNAKHRFTVSSYQTDNEEILFENTIGTAVYAVPILGSVYDFIVSPDNRAAVIILAFALILSSVVYEIIVKKRKNGNN